MSREWKPGDVAMVECSDGNERIAFAVTNQYDDGISWWFGNRVYRWASSSAARPLVVIDPEDREQVERLVSRWTAAEVGDGLSFVDALQAALRSLVVPPKPEEPKGLGAVVEDSRGNRWIRCVHGATQATWKQEDHVSVSDWTDYADIAAVKVLSEGVTP